MFVNYAGRRKGKCIGANKAAAEQVKRVIEAKLALGDLGFLQDAQAAEEKKTTFHQYANDWVERYATIHCKVSTVASHHQPASAVFAAALWLTSSRTNHQ